MDNEQFLTTIHKQCSTCLEVLGKKEKLYGIKGDRLCQFKRAAVLQGISEVQALGGLMVEHTTTLYSMIAKETDHFSLVEDISQWDKVITNHINYLFLLKAQIEEISLRNEMKTEEEMVMKDLEEEGK